MSKIKYKMKNAAHSATYFTGKFAFAPVVAVIDTAVVVGQTTASAIKVLGTGLVEATKAPFQGVVRANEFHRAKFGFKYQEKRDINRKLADGELVEIVVPASNYLGEDE